AYAALLRVCALALPFLGGRRATPARLALESPMAIACSGDLAPCLPWRILRTSSRTNSPACVVGALPARLSFHALSIVLLSGMIFSMQPMPRLSFVRRRNRECIRPANAFASVHQRAREPNDPL